MKKNISILSIISVILVNLAAFAYFLPNITDLSKFKIFPEEKIRLGLDLQGGAHLLMKIDFNNYMSDMYKNISENVRKELRKNKIKYRKYNFNNKAIEFEISEESDSIKKINKIVKSTNNALEIEQNKQKILIKFNKSELNTINNNLIEQSIEIIRMRVDDTGTKEPIIQRQGNEYILLQVPGESDPTKLKNLLGKTAQLTFNMLANNNIDQNNNSKTTRLLPANDPNDQNLYNVQRNVMLNGSSLNDARISFDKDSKPVVAFTFNSYGSKKFAQITKNHRGERLAIILDNKVISTPQINEPIIGGQGIITGSFSIESASELALLLRAGALPAPLEIVEERTIGPNLGADSIEAGKKAALISFVLVIIFMLFKYRILGIFSCICLALAIIYIIAIMTFLQATLTMPGIAGIILTIGMAVDANVLIYERIKEEIKAGNSGIYCVKCGFESALSTITDSNITTLIAAFLLYNFGIGAIKGFAVTLTVGIFVSMFTALVVTKLMIDLWLKYCKPNKII